MHVCGGQIDGSVPAGATAANTVIAYEPVWAIGTGKTPTGADIAAMHAHIRDCLIEQLGAAGGGMRILYGGSVKPSQRRGNPRLAGCRRRTGRRRQPEGRSDFLAIIARCSSAALNQVFSTVP